MEVIGYSLQYKNAVVQGKCSVYYILKKKHWRRGLLRSYSDVWINDGIVKDYTVYLPPWNNHHK